MAHARRKRSSSNNNNNNSAAAAPSASTGRPHPHRVDRMAHAPAAPPAHATASAAASRRRMRTLVAKVPTPSLRPVLLQLLAHVEAVAKEGAAPLAAARADAADAAERLEARLDEADATCARLQEIAAIAAERQRRSEAHAARLEERVGRLEAQATARAAAAERDREEARRARESLRAEIRSVRSEVDDKLFRQLQDVLGRVRGVEQAVEAAAAAQRQRDAERKAADMAAAAERVLMEAAKKTGEKTPDEEDDEEDEEEEAEEAEEADDVPSYADRSSSALLEARIRGIVERQVEVGLGIVAEHLLQTKEQVAKLKAHIRRADRRASDAVRGLGAEVASLSAVVETIGLRTQEVRARQAVSGGQLAAELEILKDEVLGGRNYYREEDTHC